MATQSTTSTPRCMDCNELLHWGPQLITGHWAIICDAYAHQFVDGRCMRDEHDCPCPASAATVAPIPQPITIGEGC